MSLCPVVAPPPLAEQFVSLLPVVCRVRRSQTGFGTLWQPPDTFYRWGPKWSKGQWMHHTQPASFPPSLSLTPCFFLLPSGYRSILRAFHWELRSRLRSIASYVASSAGSGVTFKPSWETMWVYSAVCDLWGECVGYITKTNGKRFWLIWSL